MVGSRVSVHEAESDHDGDHDSGQESDTAQTGNLSRVYLPVVRYIEKLFLESYAYDFWKGHDCQQYACKESRWQYRQYRIQIQTVSQKFQAIHHTTMFFKVKVKTQGHSGMYPSGPCINALPAAAVFSALSSSKSESSMDI